MPDPSPEVTPPPGPPKVWWGILRWFAANPLVGFVSFVVGIVSLAGTFYFGVASLQKRELCIFVSPVRTLIVRGGRSSDLHVLYKGQLVSTDVTALQVGLWNAGNESIKPEHILEPIILQTVPRVPILEAKLHFVNRPLTNVALDTTHITDGKVGVNWRILEHNDAAVIQLIIAGPVEEEITAMGSLEGQSSIISIKPGSLRAIDFPLVQLVVTMVLLAAAITMSLMLMKRLRPVEVPQRGLLWRGVVSLGMLIIVLILIFFVGHSRDSPSPLRFDTTMPDDRPPPPVPPDS